MLVLPTAVPLSSCPEPGFFGAAGHVGWYVPHLMLQSPPTLGLTDSRCRAREVLQLKKI